MSNLGEKVSEHNDFANKIKNDLTDYFKYIDLLEKKRPADKIKLIEDFINSERNLQKRIHFIEELDKEELVGRQVIETLEDEELRIKQQKEEIRPFTVQSFFNYFFSHRNRIKNFGLRTKIMENAFISLRISSDAIRYYKKLLDSNINYIMKPTSYLIEHGWETLDKYSYNLIVLFSKFQKQFHLEGEILQKNDINAVFKHVEVYIESYLTLLSNPVYKDNIKQAFSALLINVPNYKKYLNEIFQFIDDVANTESRGMCFVNVILGIYMLKYREFIKLNQIQRLYQTTPVDSKKYNFSPKIYQQVTYMIESMEENYREAEKELFYLKFIGSELSFESPDDHPISLLFAKYYFINKIKDINDFQLEVLKNDEGIVKKQFIESFQFELASPIIRLTKGFLEYYNTFLNGKLSLQIIEGQIESVEIFREIFNEDINSFKESIKEYEGIRENNPHLTISHASYEHFNATGHVDLEKEAKLALAIKKIVSSFYSISEKVLIILYNNFSIKYLSGEQLIAISQNKNDPLTELILKPQLIPYSVNLIKNSGLICDKPVIHVLNEIMLFCVNISFLMNHPPVSFKKWKEKKFLKSSEDYLILRQKIQ